MSGLGGATVVAKTSANIRLTGLGSATVFRKLVSRVASASGLGNVSWK